MGSLGLILSEEAYYGFKLVGLNRCFFAPDEQSLHRALNAVKTDKAVSLVIIEKKLMDMLSKEEISEVNASESPFFFIFDTSASHEYSEEINTLIKRLGISINGS